MNMFRVFQPDVKRYAYGKKIEISAGGIYLCGIGLSDDVLMLDSLEDVEIKTNYTDFYGKNLYTGDLVMNIATWKVGEVARNKDGIFVLNVGNISCPLSEYENQLMKVAGRKLLQLDYKQYKEEHHGESEV